MSAEKWHKFDGGYGMGYRVYVELRNDSWMDFVIVGIVTESAGDRGEVVEEYWATEDRQLDDAESLTRNVEKAATEMSGYIKWDGCCGVTIKTDHLCGRGDAEAFCAVIMHLFDEARRLMPNSSEIGRGL